MAESRTHPIFVACVGLQFKNISMLIQRIVYTMREIEGCKGIDRDKYECNPLHEVRTSAKIKLQWHEQYQDGEKKH